MTNHPSPSPDALYDTMLKNAAWDGRRIVELMAEVAILQDDLGRLRRNNRALATRNRNLEDTITALRRQLDATEEEF